MKVFFVTIVLDGMPWITHHWQTFRNLPFPWEWHVVEGVAAPEKCTAWCKKIAPRLSLDGTSGFLTSIAAFDKRVKLHQWPIWAGKVDMLNTALEGIKEAGLLWQIDSDEVWTGEQIELVRRMFRQCPARTEAHFRCRYFVGPNIVTVGDNCFGNNGSYEWRRVWKFSPKMKFRTHEPPVLIPATNTNPFTRDETTNAGLVFDHYAYATEAAVAFKQEYYGATGEPYGNAVADWRKLQANTIWPVKRLKYFLPWVDETVGAKKL